MTTSYSYHSHMPWQKKNFNTVSHNPGGACLGRVFSTTHGTMTHMAPTEYEALFAQCCKPTMACKPKFLELLLFWQVSSAGIKHSSRHQGSLGQVQGIFQAWWIIRLYRIQDYKNHFYTMPGKRERPPNLLAFFFFFCYRALA